MSISSSRPTTHTDSSLRSHPTLSLTFSSLLTALDSETVVLRVHSSASASPLRWTRDPSTSGFCSPNENLLLSRSAYANTVALTSIKDNELPLHNDTFAWADAGPFTRQSVLDHLLGKERLTEPNVPSIEMGPEVPRDELSPWISCSGSMVWCIWEIARRLAQSIPYSSLAQSSHLPPSTETDAPVVNLAVVRMKGPKKPTPTGRPDPRRTLRGWSGEIILCPRLRLAEARGKLTFSQKNARELAEYTSTRSAEVLFLGRIFPESILFNMIWTVNKTPFDLPQWLLRNHFSVPSKLPGWLANLVWNPKSDDFEVASRRINARRVEVARMERGRGQGRGAGSQ